MNLSANCSKLVSAAACISFPSICIPIIGTGEAIDLKISLLLVAAFQRIVSLPLYSKMTEDEVHRVIETVHDLVKRNRR